MRNTLVKTARGFAGRGGGRWGRVPQPQPWYDTNVQMCGMNPFSAGTSRPISGVPLGFDLISNSAVAADHISLYNEGIISSPSCMEFGINGMGKSTLALTVLMCLIAMGVAGAVFDPIKGEHAEAMDAVGADVFRIATGRGTPKLNPVSSGALGKAADWVGGLVGEELRELALSKARDQVIATAKIARGKAEPLSDIEVTVLKSLVTSLKSRFRNPGTADLLEAFDHAPLEVLVDGRVQTAAEFGTKFAKLGDTLSSMIRGELGELFGTENVVEINAGNPAGFCFDTSMIKESNEQLLSAAMLNTWSTGMDAIDAHWEIAKYEKALAERAASEGEIYEPKVLWRGYSTLMDEFWYPVRTVPGMVDLVDALSRTNRSKGTGEWKITHSPKDFQMLADPADRIKAQALAEKCGLWVIMALTSEDMKILSGIRRFEQPEIDMVTSFNTGSGWTGARLLNGKQPPPPGAGKAMLKVDGKPGVPFRLRKGPTLAGLHVTDDRYTS